MLKATLRSPGPESSRRSGAGSSTARLAWLALFALLALFTPAAAEAHPEFPGGPEEGGGALVLRPEGGGGTIELGPADRGALGAMLLENTGPGLVRISRVWVRPPEGEVVHPTLVAELEGGSRTATLLPGQKRRVLVRWLGGRADEVYGHVLVASNATNAPASAPPEPGASEDPRAPDSPGSEEARALAAGVHGERGRGLGPLAFLGRHALSLLWLLPFVGAALAGLSARLPKAPAGLPRRLVVGSLGATALLATWVAARFDRRFWRADGQEGFQFVERGPLLPGVGAEYFLGVDGLSMPFVLAASLVALAAALASKDAPPARGGPVPFAGIAALTGASIGALVSLDVLVFGAFSTLGLAAAALPLARGRPAAARAASRLALFGALGGIAALAALLYLAAHGGPSRLVDGRMAAATLAVPDLARVPWPALGLELFGGNALKVCFTALLLGLGARVALFPLHVWLPGALREAPAGLGAVLVGAHLPAGLYALARFGFFALPQGARWAAAAVMALGAATAIWAGLCALGEREPRRVVAFGVMGHLGLALVGLGAMTPTSIQAALVLTAGSALGGSLLLLTLPHLERSAFAPGPLFRRSPRLALLASLGFASLLGAPGALGFWGLLLCLLGASARSPLLALLAGLGAVLVSAGGARALLRLLREPREAPPAEPGAEPGEEDDAALTDAERLAPLALGLVALLLGVFPRPLLAMTDRAVLDLHRSVDPPGLTQVAARGSHEGTAVALRAEPAGGAPGAAREAREPLGR